MSEPYVVGTKQRVTGTFKNAAGSAADPSTIAFQYRKPGASTVTLVYGTDAALMRSATGVYYVDLTIGDGEHGIWQYRWESTGTPATAMEGSFRVANSEFD